MSNRFCCLLDNFQIAEIDRRSGDVACMRSFCSKKGFWESVIGSTAHCAGESFGTWKVHIFFAENDDIWRETQSWTALNEIRRRVRIWTWELWSVTSSAKRIWPWPWPCTFWSKWLNIGSRSVSSLTAIAQSLPTLFRITGIPGHRNKHWLHVSPCVCVRVRILCFCTCVCAHPCMG